jgi:DNA adenine methylase
MIPYLGHKSRFASKIIPNIPDKISTYVEPFGGMFGIYFCLDLDIYNQTKFVYNDVNYFNYNLFKHLTNPEFMKFLSDFHVDKQFYELSKIKIYEADDWSKAIFWLVILCCPLSQVDILKGDWKSEDQFETVKSKLFRNQKYLNQNLSINCKDYREIISTHDSEETFFFIDPPYYQKESYYINHDFTTDRHHIELADIVKKISGKFMISYLHFPKLDEWYSGYRIIDIQTNMGRECVIMNY